VPERSCTPQSSSPRPPGTRAGDGKNWLEFNFTKIPLDLVIEYRPTVGLLPDPGLDLVDFTAHLRVYFSRLVILPSTSHIAISGETKVLESMVTPFLDDTLPAHPPPW